MCNYNTIYITYKFPYPKGAHSNRYFLRLMHTPNYDGPDMTPFIYTLMYVKEKELV